jgi:DNA-binding MarR family transcriptional regulator
MSLKERYLRNVVKLSEIYGYYIEKEVGTIEDVSSCQIKYLSVISEYEKITLSDVAKRLNITKPSANAIINKLINLNYVRKEQSEDDKRQYFLYIDKKGEKALKQLNQAHENFVNHMIEKLGEKDFQKLVELIEKV